MEIWELASALGANRADDDDDPQADPSDRSWNARRAAALERGEPEPRWEDQPLTAAEQAQQRRMMEQFAPMVPPSEAVSPSE